MSRILLLAVLTLTGCQKLSPLGGASDASQLQGYWVWSRVIENGAVKLTISDSDMVGKVGPTGWPGCPAGIICTRYGMKKLAFGAGGEFWNMTNVTTSSDYNDVGDFDTEGDQLLTKLDTQYSCAHPDGTYDSTATGKTTWYLESGELWVGSGKSWTVYRSVSATDFYGKYMIRICMDRGSNPRCHPGCFSDDYGR